MNRAQRRHATALERKAAATGVWGRWRHECFPAGTVGQSGWVAEIQEGWANELYAVFVRDAPNGITHLAIRTISSLEPPWRDLQRIKNELLGEDRYAVQIYPAQDRLIDEADMYHLWVMPKGHTPDFGLHPKDEGEVSVVAGVAA